MLNFSSYIYLDEARLSPEALTRIHPMVNDKFLKDLTQHKDRKVRIAAQDKIDRRAFGL